MPAPILIVEDDTDINNMMAEALTKAGYACTQAFSGRGCCTWTRAPMPW